MNFRTSLDEFPQGINLGFMDAEHGQEQELTR